MDADFQPGTDYRLPTTAYRLFVADAQLVIPAKAGIQVLLTTKCTKAAKGKRKDNAGTDRRLPFFLTQIHADGRRFPTGHRLLPSIRRLRRFPQIPN